jgi:hypothetical protein
MGLDVAGIGAVADLASSLINRYGGLMRALLTAIILAVPAASAQAPQEPETVTFTRAQLEQLQTELETIVQRRERAAFEAGKNYQKAALLCGQVRPPDRERAGSSRAAPAGTRGC